MKTVKRLRVLTVVLALAVCVNAHPNQPGRGIREDARAVADQERALMAGFALGLESITSEQVLTELYQLSEHPLLSEKTGLVSHILIVDGGGRIVDSLDPKYSPVKGEDGALRYLKLSEVPLPILITEQAASGTAHVGQKQKTIVRPTQRRALSLAVKTTAGRLQIIVALR